MNTKEDRAKAAKWQAILAKTAEVMAVPDYAITTPEGPARRHDRARYDARRIVMWLSVKQCGMRLREVGVRFGVTAAVVSRNVRFVESRRQTEPDLHGFLNRIWCASRSSAVISEETRRLIVARVGQAFEDRRLTRRQPKCPLTAMTVALGGREFEDWPDVPPCDPRQVAVSSPYDGMRRFGGDATGAGETA